VLTPPALLDKPGLHRWIGRSTDAFERFEGPGLVRRPRPLDGGFIGDDLIAQHLGDLASANVGVEPLGPPLDHQEANGRPLRMAQQDDFFLLQVPTEELGDGEAVISEEVEGPGLAARLAAVAPRLADAAPVPLDDGEVLLEDAQERGEGAHRKPMPMNDEQDGIGAVFAAYLHPLLDAADLDKAAFVDAVGGVDGENSGGAVLEQGTVREGEGQYEREEANQTQEDDDHHTILPAGSRWFRRTQGDCFFPSRCSIIHMCIKYKCAF
jgi:hypothetical protein